LLHDYLLNKKAHLSRRIKLQDLHPLEIVSVASSKKPNSTARVSRFQASQEKNRNIFYSSAGKKIEEHHRRTVEITDIKVVEV